MGTYLKAAGIAALYAAPFLAASPVAHATATQAPLPRSLPFWDFGSTISTQFIEEERALRSLEEAAITFQEADPKQNHRTGAENSDLPTTIHLVLDDVARIAHLSSWPENWNGYDVAAPKPESIRHASYWIRDLFFEIESLEADWKSPHVSADENGDVALQWWSGEKGLTVYISEHGADYVRDTSPVISEMEDGEANTPEERRALWQWLTN